MYWVPDLYAGCILILAVDSHTCMEGIEIESRSGSATKPDGNIWLEFYTMARICAVDCPFFPPRMAFLAGE